MPIIEYQGKKPRIADDAYIAPTAVVIGDVIIEEGANVWFGAVLRGDVGQIVIGPRVSIQDNSVVHVNRRHNTVVKADVVVGHAVVIEGCLIEEGALIGMNATVLSGSTVGAGAIIAAGSVVRENQTIPPAMLAAGVPAKVKGPVSDTAQEHAAQASESYQRVSKTYKDMNWPGSL
ncbi:MAG: gamma carbonic anhydrase family protein [Anaerolineae bacterium]|nr:gamma carbonic anhydrase family protein [Anaerolineae bacterium]